MDDLDGHLMDLSIIDDILIVGHVDSLIDNIRQNALNSPVSIVSNIIGVDVGLILNT